MAELNRSWLEQLRIHVPQHAEHAPAGVPAPAALQFAPPTLTVHDGRRRAFRMAGAAHRAGRAAQREPEHERPHRGIG